MGLTTRFGMTTWGDADGGSITDNGGAAGSSDVRFIDTRFSYYDQHVHVGGDPVADPSAGPSLVEGSDGVLEPGAELFYRVSFVDRFGGETAASDEVSLVLSAAPSADSPPSLVGAVGAGLTPGTYFYALTAVTASGESVLSPQAPILVVMGRQQVQVGLPPLPIGVASWSLWRLGEQEQDFTRVASGLAGSTVFTDAGVVSDPLAGFPGHTAPDTSSAGGGRSVTVTLPGAVVPDGVVSWRVYRAESSGDYSFDSLVHEVVEPDQATGLLATSMVDDGRVTSEGQPTEVSRAIVPAAVNPFPTGTELPGTVPLVDGVPFVLSVDHSLWLSSAGSWVQVTGGGGSDDGGGGDTGGGGDAGGVGDAGGGASSFTAPASATWLVSPGGFTFEQAADDDGAIESLFARYVIPNMTADGALPARWTNEAGVVHAAGTFFDLQAVLSPSSFDGDNVAAADVTLPGVVTVRDVTVLVTLPDDQTSVELALAAQVNGAAGLVWNGPVLRLTSAETVVQRVGGSAGSPVSTSVATLAGAVPVGTPTKVRCLLAGRWLWVWIGDTLVSGTDSGATDWFEVEDDAVVTPSVLGVLFRQDGTMTSPPQVAKFTAVVRTEQLQQTLNGASTGLAGWATETGAVTFTPGTGVVAETNGSTVELDPALSWGRVDTDLTPPASGSWQATVRSNMSMDSGTRTELVLSDTAVTLRQVDNSSGSVLATTDAGVVPGNAPLSAVLETTEDGQVSAVIGGVVVATLAGTGPGSSQGLSGVVLNADATVLSGLTISPTLFLSAERVE